ncbi:MAG: T9SS type A sorting domain-containing protein [Saprospiraceae bacterium]|nr:T9SS type A sorting domain-containing protein [Saprospiraceae bacterium]
MKNKLFLCLLLVVSITLQSITINVPGDYSTIQEGIAVANDGDVVLVTPGTYVENIDFLGKAITVGSLYFTTQDTSYISQTIIDGNHDGSVVTFNNNEDSTAVLSGFTIQNGYRIVGSFLLASGGGISCIGYGDIASPRLENLIVKNNYALNFGGGIAAWGSSRLKKIVLKNNSAGGGGALSIGNCIVNGVLVSNNFAEEGGGGIHCKGENCILSNVTCVNNYAELGSGLICVSGGNPIIVNSIFRNDTDNEIYLHETLPENSATISFCDVEGGIDAIVLNGYDVNWLEGNIDTDPMFSDPENGDFTLQANSPCIDAGTAYFEYEGIGYLDLEPDDYNGIAPDIGYWEYEINDVQHNEIIQNISTLNIFPNPFNPIATISFSLRDKEKVNISIYNIKGQKIIELADEKLSAGDYNYTWDADKCASGIYFVRFSTGNDQELKKIILLK